MSRQPPTQNPTVFFLPAHTFTFTLSIPQKHHFTNKNAFPQNKGVSVLLTNLDGKSNHLQRLERHGVADDFASQLYRNLKLGFRCHRQQHDSADSLVSAVLLTSLPMPLLS